MTASASDDLFGRAARGERTGRPPIWLMRQAGRSDPEYRRVRDETGLPLEDLFRHPEHAARISLLPRRFGVDAIIVYQDILTPLSPMGAHFVFDPAPRLTTPVATVRDVDALHVFEVEAHLGFVGETLDRIRDELRGALPVLGFAGAPLTNAAFILEGGSFHDRIDATLRFLREEPAAAHRLLEKLAAVTADYLRYQGRHGVAAVQLFESVAHLIPVDLYREFALPYQQRIFGALKGEVKTIQFARELNDIALLDAARADIISLPSRISIAAARSALGQERVFQGNLDNQLLARGPLDAIEAAARECVASGEGRGHIFNLSHGLLRDTPFEHVLHLIQIVRGASV